MKYRFTCPKCGHGQESSFVRIGAQVECPQCEEVFRIEPDTLEGGPGGALGLPAGRPAATPESAGGVDPLLGGDEPEAIVGLSGLSGLMHGAEGPAAGGPRQDEAPAGDPFSGGGDPGGGGGAGGSFRGSAESGAGVGTTGSSIDDEEPSGGGSARAPAAAPAPPKHAVQPPPTRDELRRQRARERAEAADRTKRTRRLVLFSTLAAGIAIGFLAAVFAVLSGTSAEDVAPPAPTPPVPTVSQPQAAPAVGPRVIYARTTPAAAPAGLPGVEAEAAVTPDPLGQTRRLDVTLTAGEAAVRGPIRLHLKTDAPDAPAYEAHWSGDLNPGESRQVAVALMPTLSGRAANWTVTAAR